VTDKPYTKYTSERGSRRRRAAGSRPIEPTRPQRPRGPAAPAHKKHLWALALQWFGLFLIAAVFVSGGIAYGWLSGKVAIMGGTTPAAREMVRLATQRLDRPLPNKPLYVLCLGSDRHNGQVAAGDHGRSDTILLVRLDPITKSISMLSIPRDLRVDIPGYGLDKINAAYSYGGPPLAIETVKQLTGLPINDFIDVNFNGFAAIVTDLGGVYLTVDKRYFNNNGIWAPIDLQPGYQLLKGQKALSYVRFRHDGLGDFGRMARQQIFLRELKRQSLRWSNWKQVKNIVTDIVKNSLSNISSVLDWYSVANLVQHLDSTHIYESRVLGPTQTISGISYVLAGSADVQAAVDQFTNPIKPPEQFKTTISRNAFVVRVRNGTGGGGVAKSVTSQLVALGYHAEAVGNAENFNYGHTVIYTTLDLKPNADKLANCFNEAEVIVVPRTPGVIATGPTVVIGASFSGTLVQPVLPPSQQTEQIVTNSPQDVASWKALQKKTVVHLQMPTTWATGFVYDQFRAYKIKVGTQLKPAVAVVGLGPSEHYFLIEEMRWSNPPALAAPNETKTIKGQQYQYFYQSAHIHMIAWKKNSTVYWVSNTIDDAFSNTFMEAIATSFKPLKAVK
jgi:LCP family protein required for cell wall assembly